MGLALAPAYPIPTPALTAIKLTTGWDRIRKYPPCGAGGKARGARQGGLPPGGNTPLLHYVQLPPYFIGGTELTPCSLT